MKSVIYVLLLVGAGALTFLILNGKQNSTDIEDLVLSSASKQLNQSVEIITEFRREFANWTFLCGTLTDADGAPLQLDSLIGGVDGEEHYESTSFCALHNRNQPDRLTEFDFGSTDMPAFDWLDTYEIPQEILSEPIN